MGGPQSRCGLLPLSLSGFETRTFQCPIYSIFRYSDYATPAPHKMSLTLYGTLQLKQAYTPCFLLQLYGFFHARPHLLTPKTACTGQKSESLLCSRFFVSVPAIPTTLFCTTLCIFCTFEESRYIPRKAICTASEHLTPSSEFFHENLAVAKPFNQPLYFM